MITEISFEEIYRIWETKLWPGRKDIKNMSSMLYNTGYDINIYKLYTPVFIAYKDNGDILGVNSGHQTSKTDFRSRGLYVFPEFRGQGIGTLLLKETINLAKRHNCEHCWSIPRKTALGTYLAAGFTKTSDFIPTETSDENCYVLANTNV